MRTEARLMAVRAILIDEHTMFREGLVSLLASRGGDIDVLGHSPTGEEAFALLRESSPDVVITQIDMDLHRAKEVLRRIREASPHSRIVVLTIFDNLRYVQALSKLGLAESTVKRHLANIYEKVGVGSRSEATRMALQEMWIGIWRSPRPT